MDHNSIFMKVASPSLYLATAAEMKYRSWQSYLHSFHEVGFFTQPQSGQIAFQFVSINLILQSETMLLQQIWMRDALACLYQLSFFFQFNRRTLSRLNVAQLQLIQNDYLAQIETLNEELVGLLVTRDELGMEQDAMLTDIEDLSEFINIEKAWSWSEAWPVIDLTQSSVIQTFPFEGQYFSRINIWESQYSKLDYIELVN